MPSKTVPNAESACDMISYLWRYGRAQIGQFSHLHCSAAAQGPPRKPILLRA
jgi:hypothetical protein